MSDWKVTKTGKDTYTVKQLNGYASRDDETKKLYLFNLFLAIIFGFIGLQFLYLNRKKQFLFRFIWGILAIALFVFGFMINAFRIDEAQGVIYDTTIYTSITLFLLGSRFIHYSIDALFAIMGLNKDHKGFYLIGKG